MARPVPQRPAASDDASTAAGAPSAQGLAPRAVALDIVAGVLRRGRAMDDDRPDLLALPPRDRAFARSIAAATLRRAGQIDALIAQCVERPIPARDAVAHDVLRIAVAQLLFVGVPAHAAVATAVALVRAHGKPRLTGLVNAVLRRLAQQGRAMAAVQDAARLDTPDWLWRSWSAAYGEATARAIAAAHQNEPPLDLCVKEDAPGWAKKLGADLLPTGGLRRHGGGAISELPGFAEGAWWVQDAAASLPAKLLGEVRGRKVIDLCAAPGGKTMQLASAGAAVTAVDISSKRLGRVRENLGRVGLSAALVAADAAAWRPAEPAALVLLDAPCTATGTIRRHPDVQRLKKPGDVERLVQAQDRLLASAASMLGAGGMLVYAVCSLQTEEGPERIAALLAREPALSRVPVTAGEIGGLAGAITPDGDLRTLPCHWAQRGGMDGFYAARLRRET
ncbi:MAG: RsmB/NOP family class I SAM-dependent RNA methyltransferase [Alphaproteobacteria bacterium]|nr:RsmB/NOP family class I SAM-dependent RNA methyltransferase [Alphaproteobacteria bacterium]